MQRFFYQKVASKLQRILHPKGTGGLAMPYDAGRCHKYSITQKLLMLARTNDESRCNLNASSQDEIFQNAVSAPFDCEPWFFFGSKAEMHTTLMGMGSENQVLIVLVGRGSAAADERRRTSIAAHASRARFHNNAQASYEHRRR